MTREFTRNEVFMFTLAGAVFGTVFAYFIGLDPIHYFVYSAGLGFLAFEAVNRIMTWLVNRGYENAWMKEKKKKEA